MTIRSGASPMLCPLCGVRLESEIRVGVGIDRCPDCNGLWFDGGEIEAYAARRATSAARLRRGWTPGGDGGRCPRCSTVLALHVGSEGRWARWCRGCHGTFLPKEAVQVPSGPSEDGRLVAEDTARTVSDLDIERLGDPIEAAISFALSYLEDTLSDVQDTLSDAFGND